MNRLAIVFLCITIGIGAFFIGSITEATLTQLDDQKQSQKTEIATIVEAVKNARPGTVIEIIEEGGVVEERGEEIYAQDHYSGFRVLSWLGLSPNETVAKKQGLDLDEYGQIGQSKGYGILEQLWQTIKSIFWFLVFGGVVLTILAFVPATSGFARGLLRMIASIFPLIGSVVERITASFKLKKKDDETKDIVTSVQKGRERLANVNPDAAVAFDETVEKNMDTETKNKVKEIKAL